MQLSTRRSGAGSFSRLEPLIVAAIFAAFVSLIWSTLDSAFWLDDSWTANSVREPSLRQMLRYDGWMQVTPPLFLFVLRYGISWAEPDWGWRLVPLAGMLVAGALLWRLLRRELGAAWASAGLILFVLNLSVLQQATTIKSFSWETAIGMALLTVSVDAFRRPSPGAFRKLYALACLMSMSGYSAPTQVAAASVLPLWAAWLRRRRPEGRRLFLTLLGGVCAAGAVFVAVYLTMLAPNTEPTLSKFWFQGSRVLMDERIALVWNLLPGGLIMQDAGVLSVIPCMPVALLIATGIACARSRQWIRNAPGLAACAMVVIAVLGEALHLAPLSPRGGVYLTPWLVVALLSTVRMGWRVGRKSMSASTWRRTGYVYLALLLVGAAHSTWRSMEGFKVKHEDFRAIVGDLKQVYRPGDRVIVHSTTREQFKYYSRMAGSPFDDVILSDTAWPCCVRREPPFELGNEDQLAREAFPPDVPRPRKFYFTVLSYDWHWKDCRGDERPRWRAMMQKHGCILTSNKPYGGADVMTFDCGAS